MSAVLSPAPAKSAQVNLSRPLAVRATPALSDDASDRGAGAVRPPDGPGVPETDDESRFLHSTHDGVWNVTRMQVNCTGVRDCRAALDGARLPRRFRQKSTNENVSHGSGHDLGALRTGRVEPISNPACHADARECGEGRFDITGRDGASIDLRTEGRSLQSDGQLPESLVQAHSQQIRFAQTCDIQLLIPVD